jgi:hypothetical protein
MSKGDTKIRRTLHFRFTLPAASEQIAAMIKSSAPLYQMFGDAKVRLLQNVDDPTRFLQEIEYEASEALELNRQQLAGDPRVQAYLQAWRTMVAGSIDIEVFKEL